MDFKFELNPLMVGRFTEFAGGRIAFGKTDAADSAPDPEKKTENGVRFDRDAELPGEDPPSVAEIPSEFGATEFGTTAAWPDLP